MKELVKIINGKNVVTTSLQVANFFGKTHHYVLKRIRNILKEELIDEVTYDLGYYRDENNQGRPYYKINKNACILLIMGFTGQKAFQFKQEYIKAFDKAIEKIKNQKKQIEYDTRLLLEKSSTENKLFRIDRALEKRGKKSKNNGLPKTHYMSFMRTPYSNEYEMVTAPDDLGLFGDDPIKIKMPI